jgi:hypothetical protein
MESPGKSDTHLTMELRRSDGVPGKERHPLDHGAATKRDLEPGGGNRWPLSQTDVRRAQLHRIARKIGRSDSPAECPFNLGADPPDRAPGFAGVVRIQVKHDLVVVLQVPLHPDLKIEVDTCGIAGHLKGAEVDL